MSKSKNRKNILGCVCFTIVVLLVAALYMFRKQIFGFIILGIAALMYTEAEPTVITDQEKYQYAIGETDSLSTIQGIVLEVGKTNILIDISDHENGECYLMISDDTEIYIGDDKVDISSIEVGQTVQAFYSGGIEESDPGKINEVNKITVE